MEKETFTNKGEPTNSIAPQVCQRKGGGCLAQAPAHTYKT